MDVAKPHGQLTFGWYEMLECSVPLLHWILLLQNCLLNELWLDPVGLSCLFLWCVDGLPLSGRQHCSGLTLQSNSNVGSWDLPSNSQHHWTNLMQSKGVMRMVASSNTSVTKGLGSVVQRLMGNIHFMNWPWNSTSHFYPPNRFHKSALWWTHSAPGSVLTNWLIRNMWLMNGPWKSPPHINLPNQFHKSALLVDPFRTRGVRASGSSVLL